MDRLCPICNKNSIEDERYWCLSCDKYGINDHTADIIRYDPKLRSLHSKIEWKKCSLDLLYWLDMRNHLKTEKWPDGLPYVMTVDYQPRYVCTQCTNKVSYTSNQLVNHLALRHDIKLENQSVAYSFFEQLPSVRPFPTDLIDAYVSDIAKVWLTYPMLAIQKSRDMMATWTIVVFYTWDTIFHEGRQNIFQSEDAPKTLEIVKRAYFVWDHQPKFLKIHPVRFTRGDTKSGVLRVDGLKSEILGFPQGPDQIRGLHPSGIFQDEAAFQVEAAAAFAAAKPAIGSGGRFTAVSSARPGWFQHVCQDTLKLYEEST